MHIITIPKDFSRADGTQFRKNKVAPDGTPVKALNPDGSPVVLGTDAQGNTIHQVETESASYQDMLASFLNRIDRAIAVARQEKKDLPMLTYEDSRMILDLFRAVHAATDGVLEVERVPYEWLRDKFKAFSPYLFAGGDAAVVGEPIMQAVEGATNRAERRRQAK